MLLGSTLFYAAASFAAVGDIMDSFLFAVNAIAPIIIMVAIGYFLKRLGLISPEMTRGLHKLVFRLFLPAMLFLNVYRIESFSGIDLGYVFFAVIITLIVFVISIPLVLMITKEGSRRGVLLQTTFRANYALVGLALASSLAGDEGEMIAALLSAFIIPIFNVLAVICLSVFSENAKPSFSGILLGIIKNPLIIGVLLGCAALLIRMPLEHFGVSFRLSDVTPIFKVLEYLSSVATPIALLVLGAQFEFSAIGALKKEIIFGVFMRTVLIPAVCLVAAYLIGGFNAAHFASFVALFCTPVAVSSVPMAQEMGGDTALAGQLVVFSTLFSALTIFVASFLLRFVGVF